MSTRHQAAQCENTRSIQRCSESFAMASVILNNLRKVYNYKTKKFSLFSKGEEIVVLNDFNLEVRDKEFLVLTGPAGCGKVTLLNMIAGKEDISGGDVFVDGVRVNGMAPHERQVILIPQEPDLNPNMTVREIMAATLKGRHLSKDEIKVTVEKAAAIMEILHLMDRKPKALSSFQRQMVSLACALVCYPKVVLMEEPKLNSDPNLRTQIRSEIVRLRKELNTTFIYSADNPMEALALGDRVVVIRDGFIQQSGVPQEVFKAPTSMFVAGFFGSPKMNFFDAMLVKHHGKYAVEVGGMTVELSEEKQARLAGNFVEPQAVKLGIRPEHIVLEKGLWGTVDMVEQMGSAAHLHVSALGQDVVIVVPTMNMSGTEAAAMNRGAVVNFSFPGHACYLFDPDTECNLEN